MGMGGSNIEHKQVKYGALISYILIILNAAYGMVLTPFIIKHLGSANYGIYKTITSFTASLTVIDLGMGGTIQRYVAKYIAENKRERIPNFMAMAMIISSVLCFILGIISIGLFFTLDNVYSNTFDPNQMVIAKKLFVLSCLTVLLRIYENALNGLITGHNHFIFGNGTHLALLLARIVMLVVYLNFISDPTGILVINLFLSGVYLIIELFFIRIALKVHIVFEHWEKGLFIDASKYTILMFLTSVVTQICNNLDNIIIGAIKGPELVTVYSVGLLIFAMFSNFSTAISGVLLPTVTKALHQENADEAVQNIIVKAGRIQFILLGAIIIGFFCIGKDFMHVWMGAGYEDVYVITLILTIPAIFELCMNSCLSILRAQNRLVFRTVILTASAVINCIITIILVSKWSYIGAAIGTAFSYITCSLIAMNIYYSKIIHLPVIKIYKKIVDKIWICLMIAGFVLYFTSKFISGNWMAIMANIFIFCVVYGFMLLIVGLSKEEKKEMPVLNKLVFSKARKE